MLINCTPHEIKIRIEDGPEITVPTSGIVPRVETRQVDAGEVEVRVGNDHQPLDAQGAVWFGIPAVRQETGNVVGLPDHVAGTQLIVSGMVFAASDRLDLVAPDTGKTAVRNDQGHIVAVTRLLCK